MEIFPSFPGRFSAALSRRRWLRALALTLAATGLALALGLRLYLGPLPNLDRLGDHTPAPASRILDRNGLLLYEIIDPARGSYQPVPLTQIPPACVQAAIATEDKRFYQHPGVDLIALGRAALANWRNEGTVQGGSTLTQQIARILLLEDAERYERSFRRKLREAVLAWRLERRFRKDELLALWLNNAYFGHYATGIDAAARAYFGRPANELDLAQCALLAGLPQYPAGYNPLENPEAARERQRQVLRLMVEAGYIDRKTAERTESEPLHYASTPFAIAAPHFVFYVQNQIENAISREEWALGGLRITTTLDLPLQQRAEDIIIRRLAELNRPDSGLPVQRRAENAALVAIDPNTGALLAMVGSPNYWNSLIAGAVNGALAQRQPGSAMKPITYAVALDPGLSAAAGRQPLTAATILADVPGSFRTREGDYYQPLNYDLTFRGPVSVRAALANSLNIPAVRVLQAIGISALLDQARRHGITTLGPETDYGLALTLGGGEVKLLELTAAYGPFVRGGRPLQPIGIARIEDADGALLFDAGLDGAVFNPADWDLPVSREWAPVLDPGVAWLVTDILADNDARSPAFGPNSDLHLQRPAAAKTGTTTDWRDNWTIGFTPDMLAGVWVGNADNRPMYGVSGVAGAAPIWREFMTLAHKSIPVHPFQRPAGMVDLEVCAPSGLLPTPDCPQIVRETFIAGLEPTQPDNQHRRVAIDIRTGQPAGPDTPPSALSQRVAWNPPPIFRDWALAQGMLLFENTSAATTPPVSHLPPPASLQVLSPEPNTVYVRDPRLPASVEQLQFAVTYNGAEPISRVTYVLDGATVAEIDAWPWVAWWSPQAGVHHVQAIATTRSGQAERSAIVPFRVE